MTNETRSDSEERVIGRPVKLALTRRQMFGYPAAFVGGNMVTSPHLDRWVVRLPDDAREELLAIDGSTPFLPNTVAFGVLPVTLNVPGGQQSLTVGVVAGGQRDAQQRGDQRRGQGAERVALDGDQALRGPVGGTAHQLSDPRVPAEHSPGGIGEDRQRRRPPGPVSARPPAGRRVAPGAARRTIRQRPEGDPPDPVPVVGVVEIVSRQREPVARDDPIRAGELIKASSRITGGSGGSPRPRGFVVFRK